ncbi:lipoprotein [Streptomyces sp. NPDC003362]
MLVGVGRTGRAMAVAAVGVMVLTGCGETAEPDGTASPGASAGSSSDKDPAVAKRGGSIGAAGSACELPVTFDIAEDWTAEAIDAAEAAAKVDELEAESSADPDDLGKEVAAELADSMLRQGPVTAACEVDAKPAGNIGFLRVWTGEPGDDDARTVLEGFVTAEASDLVSLDKQRYSAFRSGDVDGVEVAYLRTSEILEESSKERALAVVTPDGPVVLALGGLDDEEHEAMLPAFELAKRTLRVP